MPMVSAESVNQFSQATAARRTIRAAQYIHRQRTCTQPTAVAAHAGWRGLKVFNEKTPIRRDILIDGFTYEGRARLRATMMAALHVAAGSASADLGDGTLSNFDVHNDNGTTTHGFEIEIDDISSGSLAFTFPNPRYGSGVELQVGTTALLRYAASFSSNSNASSASTVQYPPGEQVVTSGPTCVFVEGCERFGADLFVQPTAVRYHWLVGQPGRRAR
jgi:hypothetical protein